jgi:hypothetical protein
MTTVSFLGGGRIVETVATLSVAAGHRVVLGDSRGPEAAADLVGWLLLFLLAGWFSFPWFCCQ